MNTPSYLSGFIIGMLLANLAFITSTLILWKDETDNPAYSNLVSTFIVEILSVCFLTYISTIY